MFGSKGLFASVPCPDRDKCKRPQCIFSHDPNAKYVGIPQIPVSKPVSAPLPASSSASLQPQSPAKPVAVAKTLAGGHGLGLSVPVKRPASTTFKSYASSSTTTVVSSPYEPPKKAQRTSLQSHVISRPATQPSGVPILGVSPATSQVAVPVRQAMLKTLYESFIALYEDIQNKASLAAEHALAQEAEVYEKSTKLTYRNAVISSATLIKKRPKPDSSAHDSVGTESTLLKRRETRERLRTLTVTPKQLVPHLLSKETMSKWDYIVEIPEGEGGSRPSEEGKVKTCERCSKPFEVKRKEEADVCVHHWGRPRINKVGGEKIKMWTCCQEASSESEGCVRGPHVFYESDPKDLHMRHAFTFTRPPKPDGEKDTALDVVCLDCEMVYTTGGSRVARVSVVDGSGQEIYDELVKMDDGVEVIDYNTRFSGIQEDEYKEKAVLTLASIRKSLDAFINSNTIMLGHALENDLKTLRMVHFRCVDTVLLYPHRAGHPYRRGLRELSREILGRAIQMGGGTSGHSSVEDSVATLDLVRSYVLNYRPSTKKVAVASTSDLSRVA